jgi:hypothetical protein
MECPLRTMGASDGTATPPTTMNAAAVGNGSAVKKSGGLGRKT